MPARNVLPTADELERLSDQLRRDPGSAVFVQLGEAFLALSRPRDAVDVGARGLRANPDNVEGRMMVSRAFAMLHKWKEAQAELLKVVKVDRRNSDGFRLLGEVLMRRADYDRALPVLQHAQNLSPADAAVLNMLKRAREGRPLDPPVPVPAPLQPAPGRGRAARPSRPPPPPPRSSGNVLDDEPTRVADSLGEAGLRDDATETDVRSAPETLDDPGPGALARMELDRVAVRGDGPQAPRERGVRRSDNRGNEGAAARVQHHAPPPPENPLAPLGAEAAIRDRLPLAPGDQTGQVMPAPSRRSRPRASEPPPPHQRPKVRPRVIEAGVKQDSGKAREALQTSAAVGEEYLNNLLTSGMLDVPNVRVPPANYSVAPDKVWGRSSRRTFIALFVLLFLGIGGATGYYIWNEKKIAKAVQGHIEKAQAAIPFGTHKGLRGALEETLAALDLDQGHSYATAVFAQVAGIDRLLYGEPATDAVERAISAASKQIGDQGEGALELAIGKIANELAVIDRVSDADEAARKIDEINALLASWSERAPDDLYLVWLKGVAAQKSGDRTAAAAAFERAESGGSGPLAARIARADMLLDDGEFDTAFALYDDVLDRAADHPWAFIGRSLARSERRIEAVEAVDDVNVGLSDAAGPRIAAWKALATASNHLQLEDYEAFAKALDVANGVDEPRFLVRVALAHLDLGHVRRALEIRGSIKWATTKPQTHPLVATLDAELFLANGLPKDAANTVEGVKGLGAHRARGRALFEMGQYEHALAELDAATTVAPQDAESIRWREAARYVAVKRERDLAETELNKIGLAAKAKDVRTIHGLALLAAGKTTEARQRLEQSVEELSTEYPNPLAYRAHTALAQLDLQADKVRGAEQHLELALEQNEAYLPARGLMAQVLVKLGNYDAALDHIADVVGAEAATAADELALAEALSLGSTKDVAAARKALERAANKGASSDEIERVAKLVDPEGAAPEPKKKRRR